MYIKQVIIQGFRSYRDQIIIDPFSPRHNVVVGRNGSGKSNFFLAIQFVLNDEFTHMRQEDRQQLLHEGTGPRVVSAYVEIIFDNSDNRVYVDKDEVSLRRVIGSKKDQYFIDKKNVTKTEVMNLLESAGFSRSNPYYIVKQGRIMQLAVAKDDERLKLLREVAGTRVYDERKEESKVIMKETESKRGKIEDLLKDIQDRLETLDSEKEELKEYQKWDKERRCLEYTIHDKELRDTREKLEEIESSRQMESERASELNQAAQEAADRIVDIGNSIKELSDKISVVNLEKTQLEDERQEQIKTRTKLELDVKDLEENVQDDAKAKERIGKELRKLEKQVGEKRSELDKILPEYTSEKETEEKCQTRLKACEQRRSDLYAKQGRGSEFKSREERDRWIKKELKTVDANVATKEHRLATLKEEVQNTKDRLGQIDEETAERNDNLEERKNQMDKANRDFTEINKHRDELQNKRNDLWRQENALEQTIRGTRDDLNRAERNLRQTMSKAIANGIDSVKKIVQERGISGVYGPLIENFTCDSKFHTALEVTAGQKLFNIIVDTDKTGTQVLQILNKMKLPGEVMFMPLNRLQFRDITYPQSQDVIPMISKVEYNETFKPAMQLAFGKTLICRNMEVASQFSKSANLDCITLEGDQVSRKGALTGGYYDTRKSRLELQKTIWQLQEKLESQEKELASIKKEAEDLDGQITSTLNELEKSKTRKQQLKGTFDQQKSDVRLLTNEKHALEKQVKLKGSVLTNLEADLSRELDLSRSLREELGTELLSQLSLDDQREVEQLNDEIMQLQDKVKKAFQKRTQLERKKQNIENMLNDNLLRKEEELKQSLEEVTLEDRRQMYDSKSADLDNYNRVLQRTTSRISELEKSLESLNKKMKNLQTSQEEWKGVERAKNDALQEDAKAMERIANKKSVLSKKKEECMRKIRELGSLPSDAFEKYQRTGTKTLWKKLDHCNEQLKKYSHVNKKALDQFISFSEQNEKLTKRKEELDKGYQAILDAMDVLEQRKHEAILFTFKQVSKYFTEIFRQLVPGGKATLVMKKEETETTDEEEIQTSSQRSISDVTSEASQRSFKPVDEFSGISIKVSFTGKHAETYEMNQLSGGQKTLVALTLIFAIQKCDPAPFYLFDEIDQALDPQYRKAVADMIHKLAEKAQFITTTFRPELLESADQFYGVQFKNKVSHILSISKEQAKDFVEDDAVEK